MKPSEAGMLLTKAAAFDRRKIGESDAIAWAEALGDVDPSLAAEAITAHYRAVADWIMPSHILRIVRDIEIKRMQDAGPPDYPSGLTQAQERDYRSVWLDHVKRGALAAHATLLTDEALSVHRGALVAAPAETRKAIDGFHARGVR